MSPKNTLVLLAFLAAASVGERAAVAFSPTPLRVSASSRSLRRPSTSLPVSTSVPPPGGSEESTPDRDANPSAKFGSPLSDSMKDANRFMVGFLKNTIFDTFFSGADRDFARFYALETIARVPYFSYLSILHIYETLGRWRRAKYLKLHFAESWNEMHHLLIMEELGGNKNFFDRFLAQHIAVGYYVIAMALYLANPVEAYNLNQDVEEHAASTYSAYLEENEEKLKALPPPKAAIDYYVTGDMYMFDEFQTDTCDQRRPKIENLYDVFVAIRDDELAHAKTMETLQTELDVSSIHDGVCEVDIA